MDLTVNLTGKAALVTAAAGVIGSACALALARSGADVALNDINEEGLERVAAQVRLLGRRALILPGDVAETAKVAGMAETAVREFGGIFVLVNIAGASMPRYVADMSEADWDRTMAVNLKSLYNWCHALIPHMLAGEGGRIINNSSASAKAGGDQHSVSHAAYAAAKAGVLGFTRGLAREVAPKITVNAICPGLIANPRTQVLVDGYGAELVSRYIMGRVGNGDDVAKAVLYFVAADWVTGEVTDVNGGFYID